jgi:APA family basic amino acid/polyamine antiporter
VSVLTRPDTTRRSRPPVVRRSEAPPRITRGRAGLVVAAYPRAGVAAAVGLGIVATHGLGLTPVAVLVAGLVFAAVAAAQAEGVALFPELSSPAALTRHAFGELAGFVAAWAAALGLAGLAAVAALVVPHYLSVFWAPLGRSPGDAIGAAVVLALAAAYRCSGVPRSAAAGILAGSVDIAVGAVLVLLGATFAFHPHLVTRGVHPGTAPSWHGLLLACALATLALTTTDTVADMADDARDPDHDLVRAVPGLAGLATGLAVLLALAVLMTPPVSPGAPLLGIASGLSLTVLATGMRDLTGLAVAALLAGGVQAALGSLARLLRFLAQHRQLPAWAAAGPAETPTVAVSAGAAAAAALVVLAAATGGAGLLLGASVYGGLLASTAVLAAIVAMRLTDPLRYRPFRMPLGIPVDGGRVPLLAVCAALLTSLLWLTIVVYAAGPRWLGSAWMLLGVAGYAAYRHRRGLGLGEPAAAPVALGHGERAPRIAVEFRTILIPANTDLADIPADAVEVAARLAAERRASVVLLAFTVIPLGEELDMELDDLQEHVDRLAQRARAIGEAYGIRVHVSHLRTRDPAEAILAEAARRNSQVILLGGDGLQQRRFRRVTHDGAVRRIVAEAEQRVMIIQSGARA